MQWLNWLYGICWKDCQAWTKHEKWTCCTVFCFKQPITFTCSLSARMPFCSTLLCFAIWWKLIFDNVRILQYVFCTCIFVTTCPCLGRHQLWQYAHTFLQWCALFDESRVCFNMSTRSLAEILDIITASGCVGSRLRVVSLRLAKCLQYVQYLLDCSFGMTTYLFIYLFFFYPLPSGRRSSSEWNVASGFCFVNSNILHAIY